MDGRMNEWMDGWMDGMCYYYLPTHLRIMKRYISASLLCSHSTLLESIYVLIYIANSNKIIKLTILCHSAVGWY